MLINKSLAKNVSRREFLQKSGMAALALGGGLTFSALTEGCATLTFKEEAPVIYPPLKGHKVQPPQDGCLFGVRTVYDDVKRRAPNIPRHLRDFIDYFTKELNRKPSIFAIQIWVGVHKTLMLRAKITADQGVIPFVYTGFPPFHVTKGHYDRPLRRMAEKARRFGEKYGGFFINTMWEMNIDTINRPWPWCVGPSLFKEAWHRMWHIFEENGANEYATWVIEYQVDFPLEGYYPGDDYVDWIGLSGYNNKISQGYYGYRQLSQLISRPYRYFRVNHKDKPIMQAEFGSPIGRDQPKWLKKALGTLKSLPGMKAAICWDVFDHTIEEDMTLSEESIKALREVLKDPYFI
jgi:hypothetical protein